MVIHWQDCYGNGNLRKSCCSTVGRRFPSGNAYSPTVKRTILICGKTENIKPTWKILMKDVDLGEPTSFIDHVFW